MILYIYYILFEGLFCTNKSLKLSSSENIFAKFAIVIYCEVEGRRWPLANRLILTYESWCLTVKRQCHVHSDSHNLALNSNFKPRDGAAEGGAAIRVKKESIVEIYSLLWLLDAITAVGLFMSALLSGTFSCKDAALQVLMSVPLSVCLSVCGQLKILPSPRLYQGLTIVFQGYPQLSKVIQVSKGFHRVNLCFCQGSPIAIFSHLIASIDHYDLVVTTYTGARDLRFLFLVLRNLR